LEPRRALRFCPGGLISLPKKLGTLKDMNSGLFFKYFSPGQVDNLKWAFFMPFAG
jgi:hypothetical protein